MYLEAEQTRTHTIYAVITLCARGSMSVWLLLLLCHAASATGVAANTTASHFGDPSVTYRYVQFKATGLRGGQNAVQLAEFAFYNADGQQMYMSAATNPGGDHPPDGAPGNAIDGELSTKWFDGNRMTLIVDFGAPVDLYSYSYATSDDAPQRDFVQWQLKASTDGVSYALIDDRTGQDYAVPTGRMQWMDHIVIGSKPLYRCDFTTGTSMCVVDPSGWATKTYCESVCHNRADSGEVWNIEQGTVSTQISKEMAR